MKGQLAYISYMPTYSTFFKKAKEVSVMLWK